jgi:hypothetical protein
MSNMADYWQKQTVDKPLFDDLLWSKPENKSRAGRLLVIGGHLGGFSSPVSVYNQAVKAGIGEARVILPDSVQKSLGKGLDNISFAPSNPSGSFSRSALGYLLEESAWADEIIFAGELGENSETKILFEHYLAETNQGLSLVGDSVDFATGVHPRLLGRDRTLIVASFRQLQNLIKHTEPMLTPVSNMNLVNLVDSLHNYSQKNKIAIMLEWEGYLLSCYEGMVNSTLIANKQKVELERLAAEASIWLAQNPTKVFAATACAAVTYQNY